MTLFAKQSAMRLRQPVRRGRPVTLHQDPIAEMMLRTRLAYRWAKSDITEEQLAKEFDRPREWVRDWISEGCPLF